MSTSEGRQTSLLDKRLVVVAGKGGVGRTTVAAALAVVAARRGKRVLLCQTKSKERLSHLLGGPALGSELKRMRDRLWAVNMTPQAALREYGAMILRSEFMSRQVLENRVSRAFLHAVPGLEDYSMLGKVWFHTTEQEEGGRPRWDLVILDGPATGHIVSMLRIPQAILEAVPDGPLTKSALSARLLLEDPSRTAMSIVTLAEDLPSNEAVELAKSAREQVRIPLGPLIVNMLYPPRFTQGASARALEVLQPPSGDAALDPLLERARMGRARRALNETYLEKLRRALKVPQVQLPFLFSADFGVEAVEDLSRRLEGQLIALQSG